AARRVRAATALPPAPGGTVGSARGDALGPGRRAVARPARGRFGDRAGGPRPHASQPHGRNRPRPRRPHPRARLRGLHARPFAAEPGGQDHEPSQPAEPGLPRERPAPAPNDAAHGEPSAADRRVGARGCREVAPGSGALSAAGFNPRRLKEHVRQIRAPKEQEEDYSDNLYSRWYGGWHVG